MEAQRKHFPHIFDALTDAYQQWQQAQMAQRRLAGFQQEVDGLRAQLTKAQKNQETEANRLSNNLVALSRLRETHHRLEQKMRWRPRWGEQGQALKDLEQAIHASESAKTMALRACRQAEAQTQAAERKYESAQHALEELQRIFARNFDGERAWNAVTQACDQVQEHDIDEAVMHNRIADDQAQQLRRIRREVRTLRRRDLIRLLENNGRER